MLNASFRCNANESENAIRADSGGRLRKNSVTETKKSNPLTPDLRYRNQVFCCTGHFFEAVPCVKPGLFCTRGPRFPGFSDF